MSAADIAKVARQMNFFNLAALLEEGGAIADQLTQAINEAVGEDEEDTSGPLTDRQGWTEILKIADDLAEKENWPAELVDQIRIAIKAKIAES